MKRLYHPTRKVLICLIIPLLTISSAFGQSSRLFVIDPLVASEVGDISDATVTDKIIRLPDDDNPITLIANELKTGTYSEIHLYLLTKPGSLIFDELGILADNVAEYASLFAEWKKFLPSGAMIIIHSDTLTSSPDGSLIMDKLSEFTGATVSIQN